VELLYTYHFNWRNEAGKSKEKFLNSLCFNGGVADEFTRQKAQRLLKSVMALFSSNFQKYTLRLNKSPAKEYINNII
jgi:hypothetical protein